MKTDMRKKTGKILFFCLFTALIAVCSVSSAFAVESPYYTYTFNSAYGYAEQSPDAYLFSFAYDGAQDPAVGALKSPSDVVVGPDQKIYIADTGNNRIVILNSDFTFNAVIGGFFNSETQTDDAFNGPQGLFVSGGGNIYVADTNNARIVLFNPDYSFRQVVKAPVSSLLPSGFIYRPYALVVDKEERLYIVAKSTGMGVIEMTLDSEFQGFLGAQKVQATLMTWFRRLFETAAQKAREVRFVPMEYNNIAVDGRGFLYVTTSAMATNLIYSAIGSKSNSALYSPVKKLNPAGVDVMARNGAWPIVGDVGIDLVYSSNTVYGPSMISDITLSENGVYSILDTKRNKIFTYDDQGNMLYAFGGNSIQFGNTTNPVSISYKGSDFLILDQSTGRLNVYRQTDYGAMISSAIGLYENRQYTKAIEVWQQILTQNASFDLAYAGQGKAQMLSGDFQGAMKSFKSAGDVAQYSNAFKEYRKIFVQKYLLWIILVIAAVVTAAALVVKKCKKVNASAVIPEAKGRKIAKDLSYNLYVIFHPFDGFWDIKHEKRGSFGAALIILAASVVVTGFSYVGAGYITQHSNYAVGALINAAASVCAPVIIWCVANWCLTSLMDGEGTMKDVFVTTCYSLTPYIIMIFFTTIASNFLVSEELFMVSFFNNVALIWSFLLIFFGMITIHNYSLPKNIIVTVLSLLGMVVIIFLGTIFIQLINNMLEYIYSLYKEISFRL